MASRIGQQFGNYRLLRLIGHGGFADVYLGEQIYMGTEAAIKVLHTQLGEKEIGRFREEASMVARLDHPHIIRVLDFGMEDATPYLVLSYAPNGTLRERYPKGTILPLPIILDYVRQLADALQYAHNEKIVHRDLKPENILLGRRNELLLSDFGIALIAQNSQSVKDLAGTAAYMAPEQIEAHPRPASDQYALGIIVYEWLSGSCPFKGTFTEIALKHAVTPPPSLSQKIPGFSPTLEQVIFTALAKDPAKRFASVQAFARALEQASLTAVLETDSSDAPTMLFAEKNRAAEIVTPTPVSSPPQAQSDVAPAETPPGREVGEPLPKSTPFSPPTPLPASSVTPAAALTPVNISDPIKHTDRPSGIGSGGPVTPLPGLVRPAVDLPAPLKRRPSRGVLLLLVALVVLIVGGGIFGALRVFQGPGPNQTNSPGPLNVTTAIVSLQNSHKQSINAYNQNAITRGVMFGFDNHHTRTNPYETILDPTQIGKARQAWATPTNGPIYYSSPAVVNGVVYIGSRDGKLYALDALTGQKKWATGTGGAIDSSPAVVNGVVYIGSRDGKLYALDALTGQKKWMVFTSIISYSSPAIANGVIYIGSHNGKLYAIDIASKKSKWTAPIGGLIISSPAVANGVVYVASNNGKFYALDTANGNQKWVVSTGNQIISSPAVANGIVYIASLDRKLYAFDAKSGIPKWVISTRDAIESSPIVADGLVYIASLDRKLYAFDAKSGTQKWAILTNGKIYSSPMVANGVVYVGASDSNLYAFSLTR
ncbi:MAG TPA: PQQ-binding-like beta-propeller repeat protein [Ktedonobacteraceae bacterium]|nr:PQQ-binding-like beta-propeller repeat protein [Ktedonobacteraceae bacterium]